jgi:hypothetical protein
MATQPVTRSANQKALRFWDKDIIEEYKNPKWRKEKGFFGSKWKYIGKENPAPTISPWLLDYDLIDHSTPEYIWKWHGPEPKGGIYPPTPDSQGGGKKRMRKTRKHKKEPKYKKTRKH